jgi:hypothetical protein
VSVFDNIKYVKENDPVYHRGVAIATRFVTSKDNILLHKTGNSGENFSRIYTRKVLAPVFAEGDKKGKNLVLRNPKGLTTLHEFVIKQLVKWTETGAMQIVEQRNYKPLLSSAIIVVPKSGEEMYRVCFDGSPLKALQGNPQPCHLDDCEKVLS